MTPLPTWAAPSSCATTARPDYGFILSTGIAEAGDYYGGQIRYAGEFNGFRLAAAVGYEYVSDKISPTSPRSATSPTTRPFVLR